MFELTLTDIITTVISLPWVTIALVTAGMCIFSGIWYGLLFKKTMMRLTEIKKLKTLEMTLLLCEFITISYFLALIVTITSTNNTLLVIDALLGVTLLGILVGQIFAYESRKKAITVWAVHAGFYWISIVTATIVFLSTTNL